MKKVTLSPFLERKAMTDNHLHIGQFREERYDPAQVLDIVQESGVSGGVYKDATKEALKGFGSILNPFKKK